MITESACNIAFAESFTEREAASGIHSNGEQANG